MDALLVMDMQCGMFADQANPLHGAGFAAVLMTEAVLAEMGRAAC